MYFLQVSPKSQSHTLMQPATSDVKQRKDKNQCIHFLSPSSHQCRYIYWTRVFLVLKTAATSIVLSSLWARSQSVSFTSLFKDQRLLNYHSTRILVSFFVHSQWKSTCWCYQKCRKAREEMRWKRRRVTTTTSRGIWNHHRVSIIVENGGYDFNSWDCYKFCLTSY